VVLAVSGELLVTALSREASDPVAARSRRLLKKPSMTLGLGVVWWWARLELEPKSRRTG
jgi:hypothetical protein